MRRLSKITGLVLFAIVQVVFAKEVSVGAKRDQKDFGAFAIHVEFPNSK